MISEKEFNILCGKLLGGDLTQEDKKNLMLVISTFEELLDEADSDDFFGTEGWREYIGMEG